MTQLAARGRSAIGTPLIKWPGGKRALVPKLIEHFPARFNRYYEPFFGGGALFFALQPAKAVLSDINQDLINCYRRVKEQPDDLIKALKRLRNSEEDYYRVRESKPRTELTKAARLLYLTRLSFNGIHRVNLRGEFNVPYGYKTHLDSVDDDLLRCTSDVLQNAKLEHGDFEETTAGAQPGDLVYFDPPYTVAHANNGFVKYNEHIFSWADQIRLAKHARALAAKGCHVFVSNAHHDSIDELYSGTRKIVIERFSVIAASSTHRRKITESLFILGGDWT
ncbi:Dam family site-specific DNA-(adenine-N6)-methyltransferase [Lysobacter sp. Root494]|uniref:DNA adenine methylase n=1 Tax=Lysobacter sp. Root494 TaxID=1736549 RepID=UPI0009EC36FC|nr:Dam family site-specific DNA-(adenine-N6)-methyltransferase [Lysobacter sp. Root494]